MGKAKGRAGAQRIRLGLILEGHRKAAGLSQEEAARLINATQSKLSNIETASVDRLNLGELTILGHAYGMSEAEIAEIHDFARTPYGGGGIWLDSAVNQPARQEVDQALVIKSFHLQAFDGLLQVPEYARLQLGLYDPTNLDDRVEARLVRQAAIWGRNAPPWCTFVMDEGCFHKTMGRPDVLIRQIEHLIERAESDGSNQYFVVPFGSACEAMVHDYTIYHMDQVVSATLATVEYGIGSTVVEDEVTLHGLERKFTRLLQSSLPATQTVPFMHAMIAHHKND